MNKKFIVVFPELWVRTISVEASSKEEALEKGIHKLKYGTDAEVDSFEYSGPDGPPEVLEDE